jgi:predicted nucleic acid-binding protein
MTAVFLDTVGMLAVWDSRDQWHDAAERVFERLIRANTPLVTTEYVLMECGNAAARRPYRNRVNAPRQRLAAANLIQQVSENELASAWNAFERGKAGDPGIVDCISFAVMRRLGLTEVFSNDQHFTAAGFTTLF